MGGSLLYAGKMVAKERLTDVERKEQPTNGRILLRHAQHSAGVPMACFVTAASTFAHDVFCQPVLGLRFVSKTFVHEITETWALKL